MKRVIYASIIFMISAATVFAQTGISKAQSMFIYNFSRLVEWPANQKTGDFMIGILGNSDVYNEIQSFTVGKKVSNQSISVQRFKDIDELQDTHILFVSFAKSNKMEDFLPALEDKGTLIITEKDGMLEKGSAINFVIEANKLKFEMDPANATKYGLKVSSSLQNMAIN